MKNQSTVDIKLVEDTQNLDEVVVVGYGVQKKVNLTGAVAQVTAKELESINGVLSVEKKLNEFEVKIENNKIVEQVFKKIAHHNITKFVVEEASLNEIFIAKVGASYDE